MKYYKYSIIVFFAVVALGTPWVISLYPSSTRFVDSIFGYADVYYSAVFSRNVITANQLQDKYNAPKPESKIRILIMPGHEPGFGGTEYADLKEREMNVDLAEELKEFFKNNSHYEVVVARDNNSWHQDLDNFFKENWDKIVSFVKDSKSEMLHLVNSGHVTKLNDGVVHNSAQRDVALRLYGINKWNNENNIDIAIHIHFNDYPRKNKKQPGKYSGFAIYVPEKQYSNSTTTRTIADSILTRLSKYTPLSNLPKEDAGIVEDQELIAIGSHNTLDAPSMLIEYGYIYEPQFANEDIRNTIFKDLAFQTYLGVQDFFGSGNDVSLDYDTVVLPHTWNKNLSKDSSEAKDVFALQTALILEGVYPPLGKTKNDCPRTGKFGPCTISALSAFQNKNNIKSEEGIVGLETRNILNKLYSIQIR